MRKDVRQEIGRLPLASSWPDIGEREQERREAVLRGIVQRIVEDGPRRAMASPERGRQFIPFAALRGYGEMLEEVELRAAGAGGSASAVDAERERLRRRNDAGARCSSNHVAGGVLGAHQPQRRVHIGNVYCLLGLFAARYLGTRPERKPMSEAKDPQNTCVLVTGGAGFIGSHTVVELLQDGYKVVIVDDLSNASEKVIGRIKTIVGDAAAANLTFYRTDVNDREAMNAVFDENHIDRVIHFAGFKAVGESVSKPIEYYTNNLGNTLTLVDVMRNHGCKDIIFSSSATVYGDPDSLPLTEESPKKPATNPYGWTKWIIEQILTDLHTADPEWNVVLLRYFNPIGAHPSGLMGEDPKGIPNNLLPYVAQVAIGKRECVHVFGDDYNTPDGTGVRDYIHVCDLATGHAAALNWMNGRTGVEIFNLGTGKGTSVLEIIKAFSRACGKDLPYQIDPRRPGDVDANYADCSKAKREMGWEAKYTIDDMCRDSWNWQCKNPNGYEG